jgi:acyl-CoA reductase-like NAD-dependent aldehyde dehydrogenase
MVTQIQGETIPTDKPGALSMAVRQPVGAILSIVPWNGPVVLAARAIAYPVACGNTAVFRASEASLKTHLLVADALVEAGFPPGVLNVVNNAPKDAPEVIDAQAPYGGTKNSGYGKFDGRAVIDEFTELKWITIEPSVQQYPV